MKHDWKCWLDGDAEDDATDVLNCWDAEEAAREFVDGLVSSPDWCDRIDGEAFVVHVRADDGTVSKWTVHAVTSVDVHASEFAEGEDR
jgi:hypothetical protein